MLFKKVIASYRYSQKICDLKTNIGYEQVVQLYFCISFCKIQFKFQKLYILFNQGSMHLQLKKYMQCISHTLTTVNHCVLLDYFFFSECENTVLVKEITGFEGKISSPYYPSYYPPKCKCTWKFQVAQFYHYLRKIVILFLVAIYF